MNTNTLEYDEMYQKFLAVLVKGTYNFKSVDNEIVAAFKLSSQLGLAYRIIYKVKLTQKLFVATFFYSYLTD